MKEKKREVGVKSFSFLITLMVLGLLILSGPAEAFTLSIDVSDDVVEAGEDEVSFLVSLNIDGNERLPVDYLNLEILGLENIICKFDVNGSVITGCDKLIISVVGEANYTNGNLSGNYSGDYYDWGYGDGYGYGYGYGVGDEKLVYNITLNTTDMVYGTYETFFGAEIGGDSFSEKGTDIIILEPIEIIDLPASLLCAYGKDNITISANITGGIKEVLVEVNDSSGIVNYDVSNLGDIYSSVINGIGGEDLSWRFVVKDMADNFNYGNWNSMYLVHDTILTINPFAPNGLNGWYRDEPEFTLVNPDATNIWYRWNGNSRIEYIIGNPFGLEDIPNAPPFESAGILDLTYFSNTTCGLEEFTTKIFKVDLTAPEIVDLVPESNDVVYNNLRPTISAYLDEKYQSNSGIDESSIVMKVDGVEVVPIINDEDLDRILVYNPTSDMSEGMHQVYVSVRDDAGWFSELTWDFEIKLVPVVNLSIYSLVDGEIYGNRRIPFNLTTTEKVEVIEYIDWNANNPRWRRLCRNCDEYGVDRKKTKSFKDGWNNVSIRATDEYEFVSQENFTFFIDSKIPLMRNIIPKDGSIEKGTIFSVKYTEEFLESLELYWRVVGEIIWNVDFNNSCLSGKNLICSIDLDLESYSGEEIEFYFNISDKVRSVLSDVNTILIDNDDPIFVKVFNPINDLHYGEKRIRLDIELSEEVDILEYNDNDNGWRTLCSNCDDYNKSKTFKDGDHEIFFKAVDFVGNSAEISKTFFIDSIKPKISKTSPKRNSLINGKEFSIKYTENNLEEVSLFYGVEGDIREEVLNGCSSGRNQECSVGFELDEFDDFNGEWIDYWFVVKDSINEVSSRVVRVKVDNELPVLNNDNVVGGENDSFWRQGGEVGERASKYIYFEFNISEENLDEVVYRYIDDRTGKEKERRLCSRLRDGICEKKKSFRKGDWDIDVIIRDDAGNEIVIEDIEFEVDY